MLSFLLPLFQEGQFQLLATKYVHEVLVNRLGGPSLPRKSVVRLTDRPDMTLDVYCGRKTTIQLVQHGQYRPNEMRSTIVSEQSFLKNTYYSVP